MWAGIGSMVIGRHLFDTTNGWDGAPHTVIQGNRVLHLRYRVRR